MYLYLIAIFALFYAVDGRGKCDKKLEDVKIVPKYADYGTPGNLKVVFAKNNRVKCGNYIPVLSSANAPVVTYDARGKCKFMSVVMFDPDVPLRPYLYWFVVNIPSNDVKKGFRNNSGKELASYFLPSSATGDHRIVVCLYCQKKWIKRSCTNYDILGRGYQDTRKLAKQYGLQGPQACNFFYNSVANIKLLADQPALKGIESLQKQLRNKDETKILY